MQYTCSKSKYTCDFVMSGYITAHNEHISIIIMLGYLMLYKAYDFIMSGYKTVYTEKIYIFIMSGHTILYKAYDHVWL